MTNALRIAGKVIVAVLAGAMLLLAAVLGFLRTSYGSGLARDFVVGRINRAIAGRVAAAGLRVTPTSIVFRDVALRGPDGVLVAHVDRIAARYDPLALLHRELDVRELDFASPSVRLAPARGAPGLDITRALAPRGPARGSASRSRWRVRLEHLGLTGGEVEYWREPLPPNGRAPTMRLTDLRVSGSGQYAVGKLRGRVAATARSEALAPGDIALEAEARGDGSGIAAAHTALRWGETASITADLNRNDHLHVAIDRLEVTPPLVRPFWPAYPIRAPIVVQGELRGRPRQIRGTLQVDTVGGGVLRVAGDVDPAALETTTGIGVDAAGLDLTRLLGAPGPAALSIDARVAPGSLRPAGVSGRLALDVGAVRLAGHTFGPVDVHARAEDGEIASFRMRARLPGTRLTARAHGPTKGLHARVTIVARDLGATARALAALRGGSPPPVDGRARIILAGDGALAGGAAGVRLAAHVIAPRLRIGASPGARTLRNVSVAARLGDAGAGGGRSFSIDASVAAPWRVGLETRGQIWPRAERAVLADVSLRYPGRRWTSQGQAHLTFSGGRVALRDLALSSGERRTIDIAALSHGHGRVSGDLSTHFPAAALHASFALPASWPPPPAAPLSLTASATDVRLEDALAALPIGAHPHLSGHANAELHLSGTPAAPELALEVHGRDLSTLARALPGPAPAAGRLQASGLDLTIEYDDARARLMLRADDLAGGTLEADATAAVDLSWPAVKELARAQARDHVPIEGHLRARDFETGWLAALAPAVRKVGGHLDGEARVSGQLGAPRLEGRLGWRNGRVVIRPPSAATATGP